MVGKENALSELRVHYTKGELLEAEISSNPFELFHNWMLDAREAGILEPNAMVLSTIKDQKPSARVVLLKSADEAGFVFYTNYLSHKAEEMYHNPHASLTFFWDKTERQVRIEGKVSKVSEEESTAYFQSRPRMSQVGAWVSNQSSVIADRSVLDEKLEMLLEKFGDGEIPKPPYWGGYLLVPDSIEFWQGRSSRLHDRILYSKSENSWSFCRLSP